MSLTNLDALISKFWEGIFRKKNRPVQPVEVARALVREMMAQRRVSVSQVYAPNVFTISLGKDDHLKSVPLQDALSRELEGYVKNKAVEKEYSLIGRPQVVFCEDDTLEIGDMVIKSAFSSENPLPAEEQPYSEEPVDFDHTMIFDKQDQESMATRAAYSVVVVSGPDQGKRILLHGGELYYIGRKSTNHLVLTDINASREHVMLEKTGDLLRLVDLGSRNGTYVDGEPVEEYELEIGDRFLIGENLFEIEGS